MPSCGKSVSTSRPAQGAERTGTGGSPGCLAGSILQEWIEASSESPLLFGLAQCRTRETCAPAPAPRPRVVVYRLVSVVAQWSPLRPPAMSWEVAKSVACRQMDHSHPRLPKEEE